jgi:hypothetical protein
MNILECKPEDLLTSDGDQILGVFATGSNVGIAVLVVYHSNRYNTPVSIYTTQGGIDTYGKQVIKRKPVMEKFIKSFEQVVAAGWNKLVCDAWSNPYALRNEKLNDTIDLKWMDRYCGKQTTNKCMRSELLEDREIEPE